eukprot:scaffold1730_cov68-Phaeocystis_antarctica.AAC.8
MRPVFCSGPAAATVLVHGGVGLVGLREAVLRADVLEHRLHARGLTRAVPASRHRPDVARQRRPKRLVGRGWPEPGAAWGVLWR